MRSVTAPATTCTSREQRLGLKRAIGTHAEPLTPGAPARPVHPRTSGQQTCFARWQQALTGVFGFSHKIVCENGELDCLSQSEREYGQ
jgi:hypothetical protein